MAVKCVSSFFPFYGCRVLLPSFLLLEVMLQWARKLPVSEALPSQAQDPGLFSRTHIRTSGNSSKSQGWRSRADGSPETHWWAICILWVPMRDYFKNINVVGTRGTISELICWPLHALVHTCLPLHTHNHTHKEKKDIHSQGEFLLYTQSGIQAYLLVNCMIAMW